MALKKYYYDRDYYQLKLDEVIKTQEEINEEAIYKLSRRELEPALIQSGLSNFGKTIHGSGFAFLNLDLKGKDVYSVRVRLGNLGHREVCPSAEFGHQPEQDHRSRAFERIECFDPNRRFSQPAEQPEALQVHITNSLVQLRCSSS